MEKNSDETIHQPALHKWVLGNKSLFVTAPMAEAPLTCLDLWIKGGSSYEKPGEEGFAHFLEHMVFKGSNNLSEGEFDLRIEELGGSSNAATGFDDVHYHVLVPPDAVNKALELLLSLVFSPTFPKEAFETERKVVLEEIAQHEDQPEEQVFQNLLETCWPNHSYSRQILGLKDSLNLATPQKLRDFHKRLYRGSNCTLSIAGNIPKGINNFIEKSLLSRLDVVSDREIEKLKTKNPLFQKHHAEIYVERLETARVLMAWPIPSAKEQLINMGNDIATSLLCEGRRSRLVQHLREDLKIVESIDMGLTLLEQGGLIILEACCLDNNVNIVQEEINKILKECIEEAPTDQEIKRAHQLVRNSICFGVEMTTQVAGLAGSYALWKRHQSLLEPLTYISYWSGSKIQKEIFPKLQPELSCTLITRPK